MPADRARKVAIVTGAASGIGAAVVQALAANGLNVVVNYHRNEQGARDVAGRCREIGVEVVCVQGDVSRGQDCQAIVAAALDAWGRIDVLVNNAGTTRFADSRDLDALSAGDFADIFAVNVTGAYLMARIAANTLRQSPSGSVVNVSSHSGFSGIGSSTAYAASKGALNTLTLHRPWLLRHSIATTRPWPDCPSGRGGTGLASGVRAARSASARCRSA